MIPGGASTGSHTVGDKWRDNMRVHTGTMLDVTEPDILEVLVDRRGRRVWINVEGVCMFRACKIRELVVRDEGKEQLGAE